MQDYIERALEGDSSAYEFIVREYQNRIFRYINKLIKNPEDAQEITQDVFVTGFYKLDRYDEAYSLSTWFYKIAKNLTMTRIQKNKRHQSLVEHLVTMARGSHTDLESENEFSDPVEYALNKLRDDEKNLLLLKSVEELSYRELSYIFNTSEGTLRKRFERTRNKFKSLLDERSQDNLCQN